MIRVSILYPRAEGRRFDMDYYVRKHMPMSIELLGKSPGYRGVSVEAGIAGTEPGAPAPYVAMCHFLFDSVDAFMQAFLPHARTLQGDMKNYTDIAPVIQFNEVMISR